MKCGVFITFYGKSQLQMIATVNLQSEKADTAAGSVLLEQGEGAAADAE